MTSPYVPYQAYKVRRYPSPRLSLNIIRHHSQRDILAVFPITG